MGRDYEAILAEMDAKQAKKKEIYNDMTKDQLINIIIGYEDHIDNLTIELKTLKAERQNRA